MKHSRIRKRFPSPFHFFWLFLISPLLLTFPQINDFTFNVNIVNLMIINSLVARISSRLSLRRVRPPVSAALAQRCENDENSYCRTATTLRIIAK